MTDHLHDWQLDYRREVVVCSQCQKTYEFTWSEIAETEKGKSNG